MNGPGTVKRGHLTQPHDRKLDGNYGFAPPAAAVAMYFE